MKRKLIYILLFAYGVTGGVFFSLSRARANTPVGETSGGESPASVYYDEHWKAANAIVTDNSGVGGALRWSVFNNFTNNTPNSAKPKMVVTRWEVHGHIHFR